jgi:hypothetical protein
MTRIALSAAAAFVACVALPTHAEDAPAAPVKPLAVVFLESDLKPPVESLPADQRAMLADWKVDDIGRLIKEHTPTVLQANGISGDAVITPRRDGGEPADVAGLTDGRPLLVLRVKNVVQTHPRFFVTAGTANIEVAFYPPADSGTARTATCHGLSGSSLGFDPVWGVTKTNRVDADWADRVIAGVLDLLAKQGCMTLAGPRAVLPRT